MTTSWSDPGLARERTALAWQRTALALAGVTIVVARLTYDAVGPVAVLVVALGWSHVAIVFRTARRAYLDRRGVPRHLTWPVGVHGVLLSVQVGLLGAMELVDLVRA